MTDNIAIRTAALLCFMLAAPAWAACPDCDTRLLIAASRGELEQARQALEKGADANFADSNGYPVLNLAAGRGHAAVAALLLDKGADLNGKARLTAETPLLMAAANGHLETVRLLAGKGADLNARKNGGDTALDEAIKMNKYFPDTGRKKIIKFLKEAGAKEGKDLPPPAKPAAEPAPARPAEAPAAPVPPAVTAVPPAKAAVTAAAPAPSAAPSAAADAAPADEEDDLFGDIDGFSGYEMPDPLWVYEYTGSACVKREFKSLKEQILPAAAKSTGHGCYLETLTNYDFTEYWVDCTADERLRGAYYSRSAECEALLKNPPDKEVYYFTPAWRCRRNGGNAVVVFEGNWLIHSNTETDNYCVSTVKDSPGGFSFEAALHAPASSGAVEKKVYLQNDRLRINFSAYPKESVKKVLYLK